MWINQSYKMWSDKKTGDGKTYWRCVEDGCKARAITTILFGKINGKTEITKHKHPGDPEGYKVFDLDLIIFFNNLKIGGYTAK